MGFFIEKVKLYFNACRGYSLPISILSWLIPFLFALNGLKSFCYGLIALFGIIILHLGVNIFDDSIDYYLAKRKIEQGKQKNFNFIKAKCIYIFNGELTLRKYFLTSFILFLLACFIGIYFYNLIGIKLLFIIIPTIILCLLYPILGGFGLGEVIVGIIFSPLIYSGVFLVMDGNFSLKILALSISTGLLVISLLHNHMIMDFKVDENNQKITLCRLCKTENNAFILLGIMILFAYLNLLIWISIKELSFYYLIPFLTIPMAINIYKELKIRISDRIEKDEEKFKNKFLLLQNLFLAFTLLLCISIVLDKVL